ncbi:semaphorin-4A isoform X1 [Ictidomys tridecemlineatus]|uniref:Semaphorin-4A n=2 Tax=Ictidomys tridecemlineatus TaxID=43179 RepID=A0A287DAM9_ICTTR|nr:semaphorin-4A isoform X1 [Ictidomys tridecemlineatus]XP_021586213.1 semaphorin-4A isoform X1 [Ictidomys tridecemlineatus]XP_040143633.1 semaphorin-4A isoform X1 [Ictidomys tridecemlineatus]XP_040143634.1 semaphorin-4A isoform X1 [Ictidomys tridecemlineatus]KAG3281776.1 semaphorin 4A, transcript variant X1 [Ictidomys tridecemlineatus]KAG3281777.1 semaphorin 4A, transcript variant X2 [Ictidomys tridecemlineatus]
MALPALGLDPWSLLGLFFFQLLLLLLSPLTAESGGQGPMPRVKYYAGDGRRALSFFHKKGLQDFDTLLLSGDENTLYVGAREAILALNIEDPGVPKLRNMIPWPASDKKKSECAFKKSNETQCFNFIRVLVSFNATHLYACGTFAFSPACTFIGLQDSNLIPISDKVMEGKGQSPFDPAHKNTAVLVDGMLYSGTMNNFLGSEPILMRTLGSQPVLKTDTFLRWLHPDASFVAAIPSTEVVYFFFEETASEFEFFEKLHTSRVARVCKNDVGGEKLLQKKWTTFLKAQLLCTQPGQLPFNVIRHAVLLPADSPSVPHIYAVFTSQWQVGGTRSSAVCAFSLVDIENVFKGKYKELNKETSRWTTYSDSEITPRPGSCSVGPSSDKVLTFMKDHFLMDKQVVGTPLLVKSGVEYTQLAVETAPGLDGHDHLVMYLGTSTGSLHKAVVSGDGDAYLVEEIQLFPDPEPVRNLQLAPTQGALFAGSSGGVWRVPRANCSVYESCVDCVLARDPHCAWDPESQICRLLSAPNLNSWKQDMERGNPGWACANGPMGRSHRPQSRPQIIKEVLAVPNSILELPCPHLSALASYHWSHSQAALPEASSAVYNGSLLLLPRDGVGGLYQCVATENGFSYPVVSYWVDSEEQALALDPELAGIPRERVEVPLTRVGGGAAVAVQRSYWPHFLVVTVLLALVLSGALIVLLASPLGALRARGKVQGCGSPPPGEKAPLSREQCLQPHKDCRTSVSDTDADSRLGTEVA